MIFKRKCLLVVVIWTLCAFSYGFRHNFKIGALIDSKEFEQREAFDIAIEAVNKKIMFETIVEELNENEPHRAVELTCELLAKGVIAILGPFTEANANVVQSILDVKEIPHLQVRWNEHHENGTVINLSPYPDTISNAYYDIIKGWNWRDFVVFYEHHDSLKRVSNLVKLFEPFEHTIVFHQLDSRRSQGNYRQVFKEVRQSNAKNFILDCSIGTLPDVLQQAQQVGLMTHQYSYIITNLDTHTINLEAYLYSGTNITYMRLVNPEDETLQEAAADIYKISKGRKIEAGVQLKLEEALIYDAVLMFANAVYDMQDYLVPKLLECDDPTSTFSFGTGVINHMKSITHRGLSGNISFGITGYRTDIALDILELREGGEVIIGDWNSSRICQHPVCPLNVKRQNAPLPINHLGLLNKTFIVMTTLTVPYGMRKESSDKLVGNDQYEGFGIDIIHALSEELNFNYTIVIREDKKNGDKLPNGTWTGMIGNIVNGDVDLAITDLTVTKNREAAVDFTSSFMIVGVSILYNQAEPASPSFFSFAAPLAFEVWQLVMASWFGIAIILFILGRISSAEWENPYPCIEEPEFYVNQLDLRNCVWFITGSIMQQGSEIELKSVPTRMLAGIWFFFTLLMVSSYTANLAAFLTLEKPDPHFSSFEELIQVAEDRDIYFGAKAEGATETFFKDKADHDKEGGDWKKAWKRMHDNYDKVMSSDNDAGVAMVQSDKFNYAFFAEDSLIEYETERKCDLAQVGKRLDEKGYAIAMKKNASFRDDISKALYKMQQSNKIAELKKKWWKEKRGGGQCDVKEESTEGKALKLGGVEGVFYVTIVGAVVAFFVAIFEMLLGTYRRSLRTKIPFCHLLKEEFKFYIRFSETAKQVAYPSKESSLQGSRTSRSRETIYPQIWINKESSVETLRSRGSNKSGKSRGKRNKRSKSKKCENQDSVETC